MARIALLAVVCLASIALAFAAEDPTQSLPGVQDLTPANFKSVVNGAKHVLVEYYAPWCGHCKHLVPEYKKLGDLVQSDPKLKNRVVIAKVDADAHRSLGEEYDVRGFPTIKFFPRGKVPSKDTVQEYNSGRTAEAFLTFLKDKVAADAGFARVEALDSIVKDFADADDKAALITKVTEAVVGLKDEDKVNGDVYVKMMTKASEKGATYLTKEKARVDKMLASGGMAAAKYEELSRKSSVLGALLGEEA
ncbi:thioredoxin domain-containing protein [Haematococcus lacustris]|uniref:protein disulfide-isomerase n=2 Tax=Haematococcus lacustris TaxID=44745 RepID=A0A699ZG49_HAELA|nr:thioredoxin domain-containing protein [Haematococcus lacustris]